MHIQEFKNEFVEEYFSLRNSEILSRVRSSSTGNSNIAFIKSQLNKALNLVFDQNFGFFDFPLIGVNQQSFYDSILTYRASHIEQVYYALESGKSSFKSAYDQMLNAEKEGLKIYAAIAMGLKDLTQPEAEEYANDVLSKLQSATNKKLGMYFVFLRSFTEKVVLPLKNEILSNEKTLEFMEQQKAEISFDEPIGEIIAKLDDLDKKAQKLHSEGMLEERPKLSLSNEISHFLDTGRVASQA